MELEVSPGVYDAPEDDSYGINFAAETLNQAYPGCTGLYLDVAGHMVAFYGGRAIPRRASCMNKVFRLVRPSPQSPPGWDAPPPGGLSVLV